MSSPLLHTRNQFIESGGAAAIPPVPVGAEREYLRPQSGREKECESKRRAAFHRVYRCFRPSTKRPIRSIASMISSALEA